MVENSDSASEGVWLLRCIRSVRNPVVVFVYLLGGTLAPAKAEKFQHILSSLNLWGNPASLKVLNLGGVPAFLQNSKSRGYSQRIFKAKNVDVLRRLVKSDRS